MARNSSHLRAGIIVGGLLALGASVAGREIMRRAGTRMIDWEAVREIAHRRLGDAAASLPSAQRAEAEAFYRATLLQIEPIVAEEIGSELPAALETPAVVDRLQWVDLNIATFRVLFERIERTLLEAQTGPDTAGRAMSRWVNRTLGNQQLGFMLAFLGRKVLGQYDVSLLAAGPTRGRLHFVEPNIIGTAAAMRIPRDQFRTFIALHEATHAFEFEAHPWLRPYFSDLVGRTVEQL
ncbi:MAG TPA: zinc-dependent metalloprotease, partial [Candidatus Limnocylindria bacterium]|nr:zinc-dependent metalloprotease [Candidatus Limnocylindria bacterium]